MTALEQARKKALVEWQYLEESSAPVFFVGAATCGRAAGAVDVLKQLRGEIAARNLDAQVVEVGCLGPCSLEPLVIVHKEGAPRICYGNVGPKEIVEILERHVLGTDPCAEYAVGTMSEGEVPGVGRFENHPIIRHQVRNILRNCGRIDPENIAHYLAQDGYAGFAKALEMGGGFGFGGGAYCGFAWSGRCRFPYCAQVGLLPQDGGGHEVFDL